MKEQHVPHKHIYEDKDGCSKPGRINAAKKPVRINGASIEVDAVPLDENGKMIMLCNALMPLLYAFDGAAVTLSIELTPTKL